MIICDKCGAANDDHRFICNDCGRELTKKQSAIPKRENPPLCGSTTFHKSNYDSGRICSNCNSSNSHNADYCVNCGRSLYYANVISESKSDKFIKNFFIVSAIVFMALIFLFFIVYGATFLRLLLDDSPNDLKNNYNVVSISEKDLQL